MEPIIGEPRDAEYRCEICVQVFSNKADLDEHVKSHERVQEKVEKEAYRLAQVKHQLIDANVSVVWTSA